MYTVGSGYSLETWRWSLLPKNSQGKFLFTGTTSFLPATASEVAESTHGPRYARNSTHLDVVHVKRIDGPPARSTRHSREPSNARTPACRSDTYQSITVYSLHKIHQATNKQKEPRTPVLCVSGGISNKFKKSIQVVREGEKVVGEDEQGVREGEQGVRESTQAVRESTQAVKENVSESLIMRKQVTKRERQRRSSQVRVGVRDH